MQWKHAIPLPLILVATAGGQNAAAPAENAFDVVSIKLDTDRFPRTPNPSFQVNGTWDVTGIPLLTVISDAYGVPPENVTGIPAALSGQAARFDIVAKTEPDVSPERFRLMLQDMLAKRFGLVAKREMTEVKSYPITVAEGGSKLTPATGNCGDDDSPKPFLHHGVVPCGAVKIIRGFTRESGEEWVWLVGWSISLDVLAQALTGATRRIVTNATGLDGVYDVNVILGSGDRQAALSVLNFDDPVGQRNLDTAFDQHVGLRLGSPRINPVPMITVERVYLPSAN